MGAIAAAKSVLIWLKQLRPDLKPRTLGHGAEIADQILLTHEIMDHWEAILPRGRILRVPYEVLVTDQRATTKRILDFVGLPWEEEVLRFHETARAVQTASLGQVTHTRANTRTHMRARSRTRTHTGMTFLVMTTNPCVSPDTCED